MRIFLRRGLTGCSAIRPIALAALDRKEPDEHAALVVYMAQVARDDSQKA